MNTGETKYRMLKIGEVIDFKNGDEYDGYSSPTAWIRNGISVTKETEGHIRRPIPATEQASEIEVEYVIERNLGEWKKYAECRGEEDARNLFALLLPRADFRIVKLTTTKEIIK